MPISSADANRVVRSLHYSHRVVNNSQLHLGVFLDGKCGGAMQFGPPLDKRKMIGLVTGTGWNDFLELNRLAFADWLPRNSESRALAFAFRWMRKTYPHLKWIVSFADGTQCGDGAIYRASGFVLTQIKKNNQIWEAPTGEVFCDTSIRPGIGGEKTRQRAKEVVARVTAIKGGHILDNGASSMKAFKEAGWKPKAGYQFRYIYFLDPAARSRLAVPIIPFSQIGQIGAGMYKGKTCVRGVAGDTPGLQPGNGGSNPTRTLADPSAAPESEGQP